MSNTKAELQHAINMLLEGQDLPLHARLRVMDIQARLLLVEQLERIATRNEDLWAAIRDLRVTSQQDVRRIAGLEKRVAEKDLSDE